MFVEGDEEFDELDAITALRCNMDNVARFIALPAK